MKSQMKKVPKLPLTFTGVAPHAWLDERGYLTVSGEYGDGACDYYGEFSGGYPTVCPNLEAWAAKHGLFWEWKNPGCIVANEA